jgi:hypothetical protein
MAVSGFHLIAIGRFFDYLGVMASTGVVRDHAPAAAGPAVLEDFWLSSTGDGPPLRVGILVDSLLQPAWVEPILDQIQRSDFARLELVILNREKRAPAAPAPGPRLHRLLRVLAEPRRRRGLLYGLYARLDRRRCAPDDDALREVDCAARLAAVEQIQVAPVREGFAQRFPPGAVEAIRSRGIDVLLRFGFGILKGDVLRAARYGIWSYHHGDNDYYRGGPAHFWEVIEGHPLSGVLLQVLTEELDGGMVLCKAWVPTRQGISATLNRQLPYWTGSSFVIRKLHDLHQHGWEHLKARLVPNRPVAGRRRLYRPPTNGEMVRRVLPRAIGRILALPWRRDRVTHWRVALRAGPPRPPSGGGPFSMEGFRWIESPRGHYYADPFLFRRDGTTWLFFEDYDYAEGRAVIACAEVRADGGVAAPRVALRRPYHLSFPFLFEDAGRVYMIPETGANRTVKLYRATRFPDEWERVAVLLSGARALDTVMWREGGRYWFFVTIIHPPRAGPQLFLFSTDTLTGRWMAHPANPIVSDARYARAAGAIVSLGSRRIRPSQDCSGDYGSAIHFSEITRLSPSDYEERHLWTLPPVGDKDLTGTHTYNRCETAEVVDGRVLVPRRATFREPS